MTWQPITTKAQLDALDEDAVLEGYRAGLGFIPTNHTRNDQAYWHGHNNGQVDRGEVAVSTEQRQLAKAMWPELQEQFAAIFSEKH